MFGFFHRGSRRGQRRPIRRPKLSLEQLEDRLQPSTFVDDHLVVYGPFGAVAGTDYHVYLRAEDASGNPITGSQAAIQRRFVGERAIRDLQFLGARSLEVTG